jgi:biopolymer transport protein ExbB
MSVLTWYVAALKVISSVTHGQRIARFLNRFREAHSPAALNHALSAESTREPFSNVARRALAAVRHHQLRRASLPQANTAEEFLARALRRGLDDEATHLQRGLPVLASIGSTAPFIGLLGTVWGVYQALVSIGMSGQGTLDKVAGPVGEALIMTGLGLAVAIPAVLAYNFAVRSNRALLARLDAFAHDLYAFITTGAHIDGDERGELCDSLLAQGAT